MRRVLVSLLAIVLWCGTAASTTYYVSSSGGNDTNDGRSTGAAWKTLGKVNSSALLAGDQILLKRGDTWYTDPMGAMVNTLIPPSSGSSGNPIVFDAYGSGPAPLITAATPASSWSAVQPNIWMMPLGSISGSPVVVNNVRFGEFWGQKKTGTCTSTLLNVREFCVSSGSALYVYATSEPNSLYGGVTPVFSVLPIYPLIYVNGKSWLTFQHIQLRDFDQYGVHVSGASDHLVFANMEADGMVPNGTLPQGFFVDATNPSDIQFLNSEAHLNYDGFRFNGSQGSAMIVNCRAYLNRNYGIDDVTGGHITYSYSHLYANGVGVLPSNDVTGAIAGAGNIPAYTPPQLKAFARYPGRITYTIDDEGKSLGGADFIDSALPEFSKRGLKASIAVVTGEQYANGDIARIQGWFNAGHDINSHSWSHHYYDSPAMVNVRYTGTGTAATMTIAGNVLTTTVTGGPGNENLSFDLTNAAYDTFVELAAAINTRSGYTATALGGYAHSLTLANVSSVDITSAQYSLQLDPTKFTQDEMSSSKAWLLANVSGLSASELVYVYPSGKENYQTQLYAAAAGYKGGRGSLSMGQAIAGTFISNSGPAPEEKMVGSVYSTAVNIQNITSLGTTGANGVGGMTASQIAARMGSLVYKAQAWGVPYGLFSHPPETGAPELSATEVGYVLDGLVAAGATVMTNTQLVDYLATQTQVGGTTSYVSAASGSLNLQPTGSAPGVMKGANQGANYAVDLQGVNRGASSTWDIGAYQILWSRHGRGSGAGYFKMGGGSAALPQGEGVAQLPRLWADPATCDPPGGVYDVVKNIPGDYTAANAQQAFGDWAAAPDQWWHVVVAAGTVVPALSVPVKSIGTAKPTKCIVWSSSTPLTAGRTACAGGIQDNLASSTDPGVRNPDCNGTGMTYQSGMTLNSIPSGAFTLANGTATNTSAYNDVAKMWTVECTTVNCEAIKVADPDVNGNGPSHFAFEDVEIRLGSSVICCRPVNTHNAATTVKGTASDYGFKRVWLHGDATDVGSGSQGLADDIYADCGGNCWLVDSQTSKSIRPGFESHAGLTRSGTGMLIAHNWFEGMSVGWFTGGFNGLAYTPSGASLEDSAFLRNRFTYPLPWLGNSPAVCGGMSCTRKNATEFKGGVRVVMDGNIFENVDNSGAQSGLAVGLDVRACSASTGCDNYLQTISDITQSNNIFRNICHGVTWAGNSTMYTAGVSVAFPMKRVNFSNNLLYNNGAGLPGCSTLGGAQGGDGVAGDYALNPDGGNHMWTGVTVTRDATGTKATAQLHQGDTKNIASISLTTNVVTVTLSSALPQAPRAGTADAGTWVDIEGVTPTTFNGVYQVCNTAGCVTPTTGTFSYVKSVANQSGSGGTAQSFVGESRSNLFPGDPVLVENCTDTSFQTGQTNAFVFAIAPTLPTGNTVTYPNVGTPNASTTCDFGNGLGSPYYMNIRHNTIVASLTSDAPASAQALVNANFVDHLTIIDNIFTGGGIQSSTTEGTETENKYWNTNTLIYHHNAQADRTYPSWQANTAYRLGDVVKAPNVARRFVAVKNGTSGASATFSNATYSCLDDGTVRWQNIEGVPPQYGGGMDYTEYLTAGAPGVRPPATIFFPDHTYCYGASADSSCVGFKGGLSAPTTGNNMCPTPVSAIDQVPSASIQPIFGLLDWHDYTLHTSSVFKSAASDGKDLGADISAIENAQRRSLHEH